MTSWSDLLARSTQARREASAWLLHPRNRRAQDLRLRTRIERDAFARMTPYWQKLGFPFERLVPSYATAIGSSSDRPAALADLMGIIVNDGARRPATAIEGLTFARGTPYHTGFEAPVSKGEKVMSTAIARTLRDVMAQVVETGTAGSLRGIFTDSKGRPIAIGGKTGSGDNRYKTFARGGVVISSRAVSRTAAFAFFLGSRYYGVITASVAGPQAADYEFTSALPLGVLRLMAPALENRLEPTPRSQGTTIAERDEARPTKT
jgi:hypothetical protein